MLVIVQFHNVSTTQCIPPAWVLTAPSAKESITTDGSSSSLYHLLVLQTISLTDINRAGSQQDGVTLLPVPLIQTQFVFVVYCHFRVFCCFFLICKHSFVQHLILLMRCKGCSNHELLRNSPNHNSDQSGFRQKSINKVNIFI